MNLNIHIQTSILRIIILLPSSILFSCEEVVDNITEEYTVKEGKHYSTYAVEMLQSDVLTFNAYFDETAEYNLESVDQWDTNKLFGFADCNSHHHEHSARFGWRWLDGKIDIIAYCYVSGERVIEKIGETAPNTKNYYQIKLTDDAYEFTFDDETVSIQRNKPCDRGVYYLLFPYFGGNNPAPHDINIFIERIY